MTGQGASSKIQELDLVRALRDHCQRQLDQSMAARESVPVFEAVKGAAGSLASIEAHAAAAKMAIGLVGETVRVNVDAASNVTAVIDDLVGKATAAHASIAKAAHHIEERERLLRGYLVLLDGALSKADPGAVVVSFSVAPR